MGLFSGILNIFGSASLPQPTGAAADELEMNLAHTDVPAVNPATGLLMVGGEAGVDVAGNAYGTDNMSAQLSEGLDTTSPFDSYEITDASASLDASFDSFADPFDNGF